MNRQSIAARVPLAAEPGISTGGLFFGSTPGSRSVRNGTYFLIPLGLILFLSSIASSVAADPSAQASPPTREGHRIRFGSVIANPATRTVSFPASLNMTNGLVEYAVVTDYGKTHESLLITTALPMDVQSALLLLRARPSGTNGLSSADAATLTIPAGSGLRANVVWLSGSGAPTTVPLSQLFALISGGANGAITGSLRTGPWLFNGSMVTPEGFGAHFDGSIIALIHDPIAILNNPGPDRDDDEVHVPAVDRLPPLGTAVTVELVVEPPVAEKEAPRAP